MKRSTRLLAAAACVLTLGCGGPETHVAPKPAAEALPGVAPQLSAIETKATALVSQLARGDFAAACKDFDPVMRKVLPPEKMAEVWKSITDKVGAFKKLVGTRTEHLGNLDFVFVTCAFALAYLDAKVVFTANKRITGLFFVQAKSLEKYDAPAYVDPKAFRDSEVQFGRKGWPLPGTLSLPSAAQSVPAVALVHGSGPHDRDETIGPNRPFCDLAWGLASRGIAVLRYEKRTRAHATKLTGVRSLTVKEEVTDDGLAAVAFLRRTRGIDGKRVFVLGHSLGAMLLPEFGARDKRIAGLISLAGATRSLEDAMVEQIHYLYSLKGPLTDKDKAELEKLKRQIARLKDPRFSARTPASDLPYGVPASYWLSLRRYHPAKTAPKAHQPMLILQGGRDYQVTAQDFAGWKKILAGRTNVRFKIFPALNHLFIAGEGKSKPAEYEKPGHVDQSVIEEIAGWIKGQK